MYAIPPAKTQTLLYVNNVTQFGLVHFLQVFDHEPRGYVHRRLDCNLWQGDAAIIIRDFEPAATLSAATLCGHGIDGHDPKQYER